MNAPRQPTFVQKVEAITLVMSIAIGALIYGVFGFTYVHANFITRLEAESRAKNRDHNEEMLDQRLKKMEGQIDKIYQKLIVDDDE